MFYVMQNDAIFDYSLEMLTERRFEYKSKPTRSSSKVMLLNIIKDTNVTGNECISKNCEKIALQYPFLTTSTASRSKLQDSTETDDALLPSSDELLLQPKRRLPLNMVISAMAEREKVLFSETEEKSSLQNLKEQANNSLQRLTFHRRCKKHRNDLLSQSNENLEETHRRLNCASNTIQSAEKIKLDKCHVGQDVYHSNLNYFYGSQHAAYSTPYAKSRFQQLYGNGVRTDYHFVADDSAKDKFNVSDVLHPLAISDASNTISDISNYCAPQEHKEMSVVKPELNRKRYQPFTTSQDLLEYAELDSTSIHDHTNSVFKTSSDENCKPPTCFMVTYTEKNITYLNKHVQNNINITKSHYEFIFEPKVIIEETGEELALPELTR